MKNTISVIAIIAIGGFAGNMLNIGLSHAMYWQSLDPIEFMKFFAVDFSMLLVPTALTLLPAWLGSLIVFSKSERKSEGREYWLYAFIGLTITIVQTSIYHLPMNLDFMAIKYDAVTAKSKLNGWVISHWIRIAIAIISGVYAIKGIQNSNLNQ